MGLTGAVLLSSCVDYSKVEHEYETLREAAEAEGTFIGTAVDGDLLRNNAEYSALLAREFNAVTPENATKWGSLEPRDDEYTFDDADSIVTTALAQDQPLKGHAFIWHRQLPSWVEAVDDADELRVAMQEHIEATLEHYRGEIGVWDVVNEAVDDGTPAGYRDNVFYQMLGPDYIEEAFRMAKAADPEILLYYNDYGIERINAKSDFTYEMLRELVERGAPIDGIGMQSHLAVHRYPASGDLRENIRRFAELGLRVEISELDGRTSSMVGTTEQRFEAQRVAFQETVASCVLEPGCVGVTLWGFLDRYSWLNDEGVEEHGLIFDDNYAKKPSYFGVMAGLRGRLPDVGGNVVRNGDFEDDLDEWEAVDATLSIDEFEDQGIVACARERTSTEAGLAQQGLRDAFTPGGSFTFSARVRQEGASPSWLNASLIASYDGQDPRLISLASLYLSQATWRTLRGSFALGWEGAPSAVALHIAGPNPGVGLCITDVSVRPLSASDP